ncbi:MAG: type VI secretion protein IcmF/TssM N-terminal domain-containing protein [Byssovorax sp.]
MSGYAIAALVVVLLLVAALVVVLVVQRQNQKKRAAQLAAGGAESSSAQIESRFAQAKLALEQRVPDKAARDTLPRYLVLGEAGSGKTSFLRGAGLNVPLGTDPEPTGADTAPCNFWFFGKGLIADAAGRLFLGGDDGEADEDGYKTLLDALKKDRSERAIDGIVLTINVRDLIPAPGASVEDRKRKAVALHKKLLDVQTKLEMCAPIYVVVTQCDFVAGFQALGREIDPTRRQGLLGWSSPYSPTATKVADWVEEAVETLRKTLLREQSRRFATGGPVKTPDDYFLFPAELASLAPALRTYIDELFIPSPNPQDEPLILRGIYFAGDGGPDKARASGTPPPLPTATGQKAPAPTVVDQPGASQPGASQSGTIGGRRILFARDLFERKIFAEGNVARPSQPAVKRRKRTVLGLQIGAAALALLFGILLTVQSSTLQAETRSLLPLLSQTATDLAHINAEDPGADPTGEVHKKRCQTMLDNLADVETNRLRTFVIPGSWLSRIDGRIEDAIAVGYDRIVLATFRSELQGKARPLIDEQPSSINTDPPSTTTTLAATREYATLRGWLGQLAEFEGYAKRYNGLVAPPDEAAAGAAVAPAPAPPKPDASGSPAPDGSGAPKPDASGAPAPDASGAPAPDASGAPKPDASAAPKAEPPKSSTPLAAVTSALGGAKEKKADKQIQDIADLSAYLLEYKVKDTFFSHSAYYQRALTHAMTQPAFNFEEHKRHGRDKANVYFKALFDQLLRVYKDGIIRDDIEQLEKCLKDLETKGPTEDYTPAMLWELREAMSRVESDLATPLLSWIPKGELPQNPELAELLRSVRSSVILGPEMEVELQASTHTMLTSLRDYLAAAETPLTGALLARTRDGVVQMKLNDFITGLKPPIDALRTQSFMTAEDRGTLEAGREKDPIKWDADMLKEGVKLTKDYETFAQGPGGATIKALDPKVKDSIATLAVRTLKQKVLGIVGGAAQPLDVASGGRHNRDNARLETASLTLAASPLRDIVAAFGRIHEDGAKTRVREVVRVRGTAILDTARGIFESDRHYQVQGDSFSWWLTKEDDPPVFQAFDVPLGDVQQVEAYVSRQRTQIEGLTKELVEPMLTVMESSEIDAADSASVRFWENVVTPLRDFAAQKTGNSVAALQNLILQDMPKLAIGKCSAQLAKVPASLNEDDYFARTRQHIRALLIEQCHRQTASELTALYRKVRREFNTSLAGRFPFTEIKDPASVRNAEDAMPDAVQQFLADAKDFSDRYLAELQGRVKQQSDANAASVVDFLTKTEKVRAFLLPMFAAKEASAEGFYDVRVEFRVNQQRETGGNQIAAWALRCAEDRLFLFGPKQNTRWHFEDAVRVQLRWAKNSPDVPAPVKAPGMLASERDVVFEEQAPAGKSYWSLLRLIATHLTAVQDAAGNSDPSGHTLSFVISTIPDPEGGFVDRIGSEGGKVRVFLRLRLTGTEKDKPLKYPEFPTLAPVLRSQGQEQ